MKRVLLDNCIPERIAGLLTGVAVEHSKELGWAELANGTLLTVAKMGGFDVLVTTDTGIQYQQSLIGRKIAVVTVRGRKTRFQELARHAGGISRVVVSTEPGTLGFVRMVDDRQGQTD